MKNAISFNTNEENMVELLNEAEFMDLEEEAFATISKNPAVTWVKFVLTDDEPNGNKQRVPQSEFDNLINTGVYMPVKMAFSGIKEGHEESFPLGVMTNLRKAGNTIKAIAAFWSRERQEDIDMLKKRIKDKLPLNVSWEILYGDSETDENGVTTLKDTTLRGVTIVGMPAYGGRTPVLAIASKGTKAFTDSLPEDSFLYIDGDSKLFPCKNKEGILDEVLIKESISSLTSNTELSDEIKQSLLEKANEFLTESTKSKEDIQDKEDKELKTIEELESEVSALKTALAEKDTAISEKEALLTEKEAEITPLKEFKENIEAEAKLNEKFASIKTKFAEAGIEKTEEYFTENREKLLSLEESAFDFLLQEMVSFKEATASQNEEELDEEGLPKVKGSGGGKPSIKEMAEFLNKKTS